MATHLQDKISLDVATDICSSFESLSFADLLSVQDLQSWSPPRDNIIKIKKQNQEFEFSHITPKLAAHSSNNSCPAEISISSRQMQLEAFLYRFKQVNHKPGSIGATRSKKKRSTDGNTHSIKVSENPNPTERNKANREQSNSNLSFGQKIFQSFVCSCRQCHAHKPTSNKARTMTEETCKLH
ncbi:hypothetical protein JCGZ_21466 [Jatropha curcas]|uniref:Uncharacterized protein n=1 Tax=Jatropha curcas TaxID=180498 RepID=A0A067JLV8_JATCU|nr:hypothetical protein JCGZ_21466 [Jatropha curcas]